MSEGHLPAFFNSLKRGGVLFRLGSPADNYQVGKDKSTHFCPAVKPCENRYKAVKQKRVKLSRHTAAATMQIFAEMQLPAVFATIRPLLAKYMTKIKGRSTITIPLLDQWLAKNENHCYLWLNV